MARIEITNTGLDKIVTVWIEKTLSVGAVTEAVNLAKTEIAKRYWQENADKIMAQMDLKGLAALIAVEASKALKH